MEKWVYRTIISIQIILGTAYFLFWKNIPANPKERYLESAIPAELDGQVFHWRYDIGWDFRVEMQEDVLYWEGMASSFEGMKHSVKPHYRKIGEQLYFVTWRIPGIGFDSLVMDVGQGKIYAHSKINAKLFSVEGEIYCVGIEEDCEAPKR